MDALIAAVKAQFKIDLNGVHGTAHWGRVWNNGQKMIETTGADIEVVRLFAFLHDSQRQNEFDDPSHGFRAAAYASTVRPLFFPHITDKQLKLLQAACLGHSSGELKADKTIMTCWDADRLDLWRVGITPDPLRLCTDAARGLLSMEIHKRRRQRAHA